MKKVIQTGWIGVILGLFLSPEIWGGRGKEPDSSEHGMRRVKSVGEFPREPWDGIIRPIGVPDHFKFTTFDVFVSGKVEQFPVWTGIEGGELTFIFSGEIPQHVKGILESIQPQWEVKRDRAICSVGRTDLK